MIRLLTAATLAATTLAACGGGEAPAPAAVPVQTRAAPGPLTPETDRTPVSAPLFDGLAMVMASPSLQLNVDGLSLLVSSPVKSNLDLVGNRNKVWVSENQAMDRIAVSGTSNMIVMMNGAAVGSMIVGAGNTVYLPAGSPIDVGGSGATVIYYTY